jgi:hypothetical protein
MSGRQRLGAEDDVCDGQLARPGVPAYRNEWCRRLRNTVGNTDIHGDCNCNADEYGNGNCHFDTDVYADGHTNCHTDVYADGHLDGDSHTDEYGNVDGNTNCHTDVYADRDTDRNTYGYCNCIRDTIGTV